MLPQDQETVSTTQNFDEVGKMIHVSMVLKDKVKELFCGDFVNKEET